jgi:hypothetical protein
MTLSLLALWFLQLERLRIGKTPPAVTAAQVRAIFTELPSPAGQRDANCRSRPLGHAA